MGVEDAADKGDALLREYARTLIEYIEYYLRFDGVQGDMVSPIIDEKLDQLGDVYYLAVYAGRKESSARSTPITVRSGSKRRTSWMWATSPTSRYDPYPAQRHRAIATTTDKRRKPLLCGGAFPILRIGASGRKQCSCNNQNRLIPSPGTRRKKTGNPRLGGFPAVKTVSAATGTHFQ